MNSHLNDFRAPRVGACLLALALVRMPIAAQTLPAALNVTTVQGDGVTGRVRQRATQDIVVRVSDERDGPVAGAAVVFTLPTEGATGSFANGSKSIAVLTDRQGIASIQAIRFNDIPGRVQVHVNVSYRGLTTRTNITEISQAPAGYKPGHGSGKIIAILAVLAAGGAGGAYFATRNTASSTPNAPGVPPATGLTPGTGTIAPPR